MKALVLQAQYHLYAHNFGRWLNDQVITQDEAAQAALPWPEKEYLLDLVQILQTEKRLLLPKSRRVMVSWLMAAYGVWAARYHPHHAIFYQSENEDKAAYITDKRCAYIEDHLIDPEFRLPYKAHRTAKGSIGRIAYENTGSYLWAIPQGDSVIRAYTFSKLIMDESEFQPEGEAALNAALSIVEKEAQIILLSSSNGPMGVMARICKEAGFSQFITSGVGRRPVVYARARDNFAIVPVHYTMDPAKDHSWESKERSKYGDPEVWAREYDIDFTSKVGALAYPAFGPVNLVHDLQPIPQLPLCLAMDFNVDPMVWLVCQIWRNNLRVLDEIRMAPARIEDMVREIRNRYPAHPAEIWVYGDASGNSRTAQTGQSDYDLVNLAFRGYPVPIIFKVPVANPIIKDRLNAVNLKLRGTEGQPEVLICQPKCRELVADLGEVVTTQNGGDIVKVRDPKHPYYQRTHASDAMGYLISREWPVVDRVFAPSQRKRGPLKTGRLLGEI